MTLARAMSAEAMTRRDISRAAALVANSVRDDERVQWRLMVYAHLMDKDQLKRVERSIGAATRICVDSPPDPG